MSTIVVRREKLIARPIDVVRAQFVDFAHHERTGVHSALDVKNVRILPEGCVFTGSRREFGILSETDYTVVKDANGDSTLRGTSGPQTGVVVKQTFEALEPERTLVRIEVSYPVKGLQKVLAPLVRIALERDAEKALEEDRVDLEERGYAVS